MTPGPFSAGAFLPTAGATGSFIPSKKKPMVTASPVPPAGQFTQNVSRLSRPSLSNNFAQDTSKPAGSSTPPQQSQLKQAILKYGLMGSLAVPQGTPNAMAPPAGPNMLGVPSSPGSGGPLPLQNPQLKPTPMTNPAAQTQLPSPQASPGNGGQPKVPQTGTDSGGFQMPGFLKGMQNPQTLGAMLSAFPGVVQGMGPLGGLGVLGLGDMFLHGGKNLQAFMPQTTNGSTQGGQVV